MVFINHQRPVSQEIVFLYYVLVCQIQTMNTWFLVLQLSDSTMNGFILRFLYIFLHVLSERTTESFRLEETLKIIESNH